MNLLLTRPMAQADALGRARRSRGHSVHVAPLLRVDRLSFDDMILRSASAIIVTSANAVPALEGLDPAVQVFAVGPDTASAVKAAGLFNVVAASGTASSLLETIANQWQPEDGPLAYASGRHVSVDMGRALALQGYSCRRVEVYASVPVRTPPDEAISLLRLGEFDAILFMSVRTGDAFYGWSPQRELPIAAGRHGPCRCRTTSPGGSRICRESSPYRP